MLDRDFPPDTGARLSRAASRIVPRQKPGRSEQVVCTPPEFLEAVKRRLAIDNFAWDLAADFDHVIAGVDGYYNEEQNSVGPDCDWRFGTDWSWCNPPFKKLAPWVKKAYEAKQAGAYTAMLVPAAVGANWWRDWVHEKALVLLLNGRITFVGHRTGYPKDLALLLYANGVGTGYDVWNWRQP